MNRTSDYFGGRNVVFDTILEDIPGGVSLDKTRLKTDITEIAAGTPVYVNKSTRVAEIVKSETILAGGNSTGIRVATDHQFKAGEYITDGLVAQTISTITTGTTYDTLNLGGALLVYAAGTIITEVNASASMLPSARVTVVTASNKSMTVIDPHGNLAGVTLAVTTAGDDNLAVTMADNTLTIALASTTASKNTPAVEVQAAVRALTTAGYDFSAVQVTGDELAGSAVTPVTGTIAVNNPYPYLVNGFVKDTVNVEGANAECSVVIRGAVRESALPYPVSTKMKLNVPLITFNS